MDVIGSLCISLDSSTVQHHDSLDSRRACVCSEAGFSSQNKTVFEEGVLPKSSVCCAFFMSKKTEYKGYS
jgi:hypothetical protein